MSAQNISNVDFQQVGDEIIITYDLKENSGVAVYISLSYDSDPVYCSAPQIYEYCNRPEWFCVKDDETGQVERILTGRYVDRKLVLSSVSGDIGSSITPGKKRIVWNVLRDLPEGITGPICFNILSCPVDSLLDMEPEMVYVGGGTFTMGEPVKWHVETFINGEREVNEVQYRLRVTLSDYYIGKYEVTQGLYKTVMGCNPTSRFQGDDYPVELYWYEVQFFLAVLNQLTGKDYVLPTEAQWEYAARGGIYSREYMYSGSDSLDEVAWYNKEDNSKYERHPVGKKRGNELGIYDMSGNVYEWCSDNASAYRPYRRRDTRINPVGYTTDSDFHRYFSLPICRGGACYTSSAESCGVLCNWSCGVPMDAGFRVVLLPSKGYEREQLLLSSDSCGISWKGGTVSVNVSANVDYEVVMPDVDWVSRIQETRVLRKEELSFSVSEYPYLIPREALIIVRSITGNLSDTLFIRQARKPRPSEIKGMTETVNGVSFDMVYVQGGTFQMGNTKEQGKDTYKDERPVHKVIISDYYIGELEVTQGLWEKVMGTTIEQQCDKNGRSVLDKVGFDYPMYNVNWDEAQEFCKKLSRLTGKKYALPTEAQWEYAARGGVKSIGYKYSGSDDIDKVAWYRNNSGSSTHPVGRKQANELGLYDMSGNVEEWCSDWFDLYSSRSQTDPTGPSSGSYRVLRGGSWFSGAGGCRVSYRGGDDPDYRDSDRGFRVVLLP